MFFYPPWPHERLAKLLRLLQSTTYDGERENAAVAIGRLFAKHRLPILECALDYAMKRGWTIFPAPWGGKKGLKKGLKAARFSNGRRWGSTRDVVEIAADWLRWPQANLGVVTGPDSGCWVVEIDIKPEEGIDGGAALAWLEELNGKLPDTLMAITPSGSIHRYFKWPSCGREIRNSASKVGRGIDIRGHGGMVIAPPSMRNGRRYRWLDPTTPIADAPEWLIAAAIAASSVMPRSGGTTTPDPDDLFDADGLRQDGREQFMRDVVWREVRKWYREVDGCLPPEWQPRCAKAYEVYEAAVVTRIDGVDKRTGLERDGRGPTAFWEKWQYTMRKWGSPAMAANAANFEYDDAVPQEEELEIAKDLEVKRALDLWHEGEPLSGDLAERYRGCASLRFHPGQTALLALVRDALTDEPQGICIISATRTHILGDTSGGCIKLTPDEEIGRTLTIGATLAAVMPNGWVVLNPDRFPVLHGVEELTIIGGNTASTAARWRAAGRQVHVR